MSRKIVLIRHAKATGGRHDRHLFPKAGAPLSDEGKNAALALRPILKQLGIDTENESAAVSQLIRTSQTAQILGFKNLHKYAVLNEIDTGLGPEELDSVLAKKAVPDIARKAAQVLLHHPPHERVWITHGMLIAALAEELGIPKNTLYIPEMASAIEISIPN